MNKTKTYSDKDEEIISIRLGPWILSFNDKVLTKDLGTSKIEKKITQRPLQLLYVLYENKGSIVSKEQLLMKVWGAYASSENITQTVNKIRTLLEDEDKRILLNHPGLGYSLNFIELESINEPTLTYQRLTPKRRLSYLLPKSRFCRVLLTIFIILNVILLSTTFYGIYHKARLINSLSGQCVEIDGCEIHEQNDLLICK